MWQWFQKTILRRSDIYFGGSRYMRRWLFGPTWTWGLRVHCIERSDADRELHDHPFWFVSFILSGGYYEHTLDGRKTWYGPGSLVFRSADTLHRIELSQTPRLGTAACARRECCKEKPAWTIVLRGRYARRWGFLAGGAWTTWQKFVGERRGADFPETTPYRSSSSL